MSYKARCYLTIQGPEVVADTEKEVKDLAFTTARDHGDVVDTDFDVTDVEEGASKGEEEE